DQPLARIVFDVPADAPLGDHRLSLKNDLGDPPLSNSLVAEGMSVYPDIQDGIVTVVSAPPPPPAPKFIRGEVNGSGKVEHSDCAYLLDYLYHNGPVPPCFDAADVDDNGIVNFSDGVNLVDYMFKGRPVPPAPFPAAGVDPTPDSLGCARG